LASETQKNSQLNTQEFSYYCFRVNQKKHNKYTISINLINGLRDNMSIGPSATVISYEIDW